jgi:D-beta-D-heptose 7-phosphate kinase/D-beta-D-heptose 1-phosphate adenosyltransferase
VHSRQSLRPSKRYWHVLDVPEVRSPNAGYDFGSRADSNPALPTPLIDAASLMAFRSGSVLVVGDLMLDSYWYGDLSGRPAPGALLPRVEIAREHASPGGAANVAANVAALGAQVTLVGLTGEDLAAELLQKLVRAAGVSEHFIRIPGASTIIKMRVATDDRPLIRLDFESEFGTWDSASLIDALQGRLGDVGAVIFSDYAKGTLREVRQLIALAKAAGKPTIVDPKGGDFCRYRGATVLSPNLAEFQAVVGACDDETEIETRALRLRDDLDVQALLLTRGEVGLSLFARGQPPLHLPSQARAVADVTGAGDTVVATVGAALAAGFSVASAAILANKAAGLVVEKPATATVSLPELRAAVLDWHQQPPRGVCSEQDLIRLVAQARSRGERLVMTNGCFDLLHPGHVSYLQQARALGDRLIVAVNDDESVGRLKGPLRPLNSLAARMSMLAALSSVDWVVAFSEDTPERLYNRVLPDVLVKGGDYKAADVAGARQVIAAGGQVRVIDFADGYSTTALIERIKRMR